MYAYMYTCIYVYIVIRNVVTIVRRAKIVSNIINISSRMAAVGKMYLPPPYPMRITRVYLQCWQLNHCQIYLLYYVHNSHRKLSDIFGAAATRWALGAAFEPL